LESILIHLPKPVAASLGTTRASGASQSCGSFHRSKVRSSSCCSARTITTCSQTRALFLTIRCPRAGEKVRRPKQSAWRSYHYQRNYQKVLSSESLTEWQWGEPPGEPSHSSSYSPKVSSRRKSPPHGIAFIRGAEPGTRGACAPQEADRASLFLKLGHYLRLKAPRSKLSWCDQNRTVCDQTGLLSPLCLSLGGRERHKGKGVGGCERGGLVYCS